MKKQKLRPGLSGLSPILQQIAAQAIAQAKETDNETTPPKSAQQSRATS